MITERKAGIAVGDRVMDDVILWDDIFLPFLEGADYTVYNLLRIELMNILRDTFDEIERITTPY